MSTRSSHHHGSSRGSGSSRSVKPASTARPSNANALVPLRRQHGDSESTRSHATGSSEPEPYWAHEYGGGDAGSVCSSQQGRRGGRSSPAVASWVDDQGSIRYAGSDMPPASEGGYDDRGSVRDAGEALADLDSESVASSRRSGASGQASRRRQPDLGQPKPKPKKENIAERIARSVLDPAKDNHVVKCCRDKTCRSCKGNGYYRKARK